MKETLKKLLQFIANPRLLLCFAIAWMITNGWSYILLGLGTYYEIGWMAAVGGAYLTMLWLPISPEKILTFAISIGLLKWLFPHDKKTLGVLQGFLEKTRASHREKREKHRQKNNKKTACDPP